MIDLDALAPQEEARRWAPPLLCGDVFGHSSRAGHPCARAFNHPADQLGHICRCGAEAFCEQHSACGVPA